ncbi:MAG: hypothetical protein F4W92_05145 [Gammaproteobacteria bacterium]|nr:hypothetical protein [Gammaproteobacteria bacterium]
MQHNTQNTNRQSGTTSSFFLGALVAAVFLGIIGVAFVFLPGLINNAADDTSSTNTVDGLVSNAINSTSPGDPSSGSLDDIASLSEFKSDFARSVALLTMLEQANESKVLELLEQSKSIANPDRRLSTQSDIMRRLAIIDPVKAMAHATQVAWNRRAPLVNAIFSEWVQLDFEAAVEHARGIIDSDQRVALEVILKSRVDWSDQQIVDLAREFGQEALALDVLEQAHVASALDDPEAAWNAILKDSRGDAEQREALRDILEYWVLRDGADAVSQIEDSISHIDYPSSILSRALFLLTESAPLNTFELAKNLGDHIRAHALEDVTVKWSVSDPRATLQAVGTIDDGALRNQLTTYIVDAWAALDPHELLENLSDFPESAHDSVHGSVLSSLARESPHEAAQLMLEIPNGIANHSWRVIGSWSRQDPGGALDWILSRPKEEQQHLLSRVLYDVVQEDPQRALETALGVPIPSPGALGLERTVIHTLAQVDVDQAIAMLPHVRDHAHTKTFSYLDVSRVLIKRNEPFRALNLGRELPQPLQPTFFDNFFSQWRYSDIVGMYESLEKLPSQELKSKAAREILSYSVGDDYRPHRYFSDEQLQEIELYLLDESD